MNDELFDAIAAGDASAVRAALAAGAEPNTADADGRTPLYAAAGDPELIRILLAAGADPNLESWDETDGLPLCFGACWGATEAVRALLEGGADPNLVERSGTPESNSPLAWAAGWGHVETARLLLAFGADPNLPADGSGRTPLMLAANAGWLEAVRDLLEAGGDPTLIDTEGRSAVDWAVDPTLDGFVERTVRLWAEDAAEEGDTIDARTQREADGGERVVVTLRRPTGETKVWAAETGRDAIVRLLRDASGS